MMNSSSASQSPRLPEKVRIVEYWYLLLIIIIYLRFCGAQQGLPNTIRALPSIVTNPADFLSKQDSKDLIQKQNQIIKAALKYRSALLIFASANADFANVFFDAERLKSVSLTSAAIDRNGTLRKCADMHLSLGRKIRALSEAIQREFEEPMQLSMEAHLGNIQGNERKLAATHKALSDNLRKAEVDVKRKRDPEDLQLGLKNVQMISTELNNLKYVNQADMLAESVRHFMTLHNQCSNLARLHADHFGSHAHAADDLSSRLGVFPPTEVAAGKVPASSMPFPHRLPPSSPTSSPNAGAPWSPNASTPNSTQHSSLNRPSPATPPAKENGANSAAALRRASLDSLADEYMRQQQEVEAQHRMMLTGGVSQASERAVNGPAGVTSPPRRGKSGDSQPWALRSQLSAPRLHLPLDLGFRLGELLQPRTSIDSMRQQHQFAAQQQQQQHQQQQQSPGPMSPGDYGGRRGMGSQQQNTQMSPLSPGENGSLTRRAGKVPATGPSYPASPNGNANAGGYQTSPMGGGQPRGVSDGGSLEETSLPPRGQSLSMRAMGSQQGYQQQSNAPLPPVPQQQQSTPTTPTALQQPSGSSGSSGSNDSPTAQVPGRSTSPVNGDKDKGKRRVHFTSTQPLVHVQTDESTVDGGEGPQDRSFTIDVQPSLTAALTTLYPHLFNGQQQQQQVQQQMQNEAEATGAPTPPIANTPTEGQQNVEQRLLAASQTTVHVKPSTTHVRTPAVYFPPAADVQSQMGSVVGDLDEAEKEAMVSRAAAAASSSSSTKPSSNPKPPEKKPSSSSAGDLVIAVHEFSARSGKEMGLAKGDVVSVRKRQGTWIYGTKIRAAGGDAGEVEAAQGDPKKLPMGWIPMAFVTKYVIS
ncbi:hypothetical protein BJ742DRAFT_802723 [Cladochytrium replicatum]|nr:hypothetical protein BJ742DRAFT_802723 [Cladochytrium replicatum]